MKVISIQKFIIQLHCVNFFLKKFCKMTPKFVHTVGPFSLRSKNWRYVHYLVCIYILNIIERIWENVESFKPYDFQHLENCIFIIMLTFMLHFYKNVQIASKIVTPCKRLLKDKIQRVVKANNSFFNISSPPPLQH